MITRVFIGLMSVSGLGICGNHKLMNVSIFFFAPLMIFYKCAWFYEFLTSLWFCAFQVQKKMVYKLVSFQKMTSLSKHINQTTEAVVLECLAIIL